MIFENVNPILMRASLNEWIIFCCFYDDDDDGDDAPMCSKPIKFDNMAFKWSSAWLKQLYGTAIKIWMNEWTIERMKTNSEHMRQRLISRI